MAPLMYIYSHTSPSALIRAILPDGIQDIENDKRIRVLMLFGRKGWIEKEEAANLQQGGKGARTGAAMCD